MLESLGPLTRWLVHRTGAASSDNLRSSFAMLEGWVSIVINTVLFVIKLVLGLVSGSIALIADATHTFADSLTSIVVIVSARIARQPPDEKHPFGHGRVESIATVTCAALLGVTAFEFGQSSIERIIHGGETNVSWYVIALVAATVPIKEWLARFSRALGRATGNKTLEAEFWHHRSDVYATLVVVAGMVGSMYGVSWIDGVMGLIVSLLLVKVAFELARESVDSLLGHAPTKEELLELRGRAMSVDGIRGVHDIVVHHYGERRFVSLHVETANDLNAEELHMLSAQVERVVSPKEHGAVCVHVDPVNREHPEYERIHDIVRETVEADRCAESFHDLRLIGDEEDFTVVFDVNVKSGCCHDDLETAKRLSRSVVDASKASDVVVELDPEYSYNVKGRSE